MLHVKNLTWRLWLTLCCVLDVNLVFEVCNCWFFFFSCFFFLHVSCSLNSSSNRLKLHLSAVPVALCWFTLPCESFTEQPQCPSSPSASPLRFHGQLFNGNTSSSFCSWFSCSIYFQSSILWGEKIFMVYRGCLGTALALFFPLSLCYVKLLKPNALQAGYR